MEQLNEDNLDTMISIQEIGRTYLEGHMSLEALMTYVNEVFDSEEEKQKFLFNLNVEI